MKTLIVANWKCNPKTFAEAKQLFNSIKRGIKKIKNVEVVICPPFIYLPQLLKAKSFSLIPKLGAQDCFWQEGAFTGEISAKMLKNLGVNYVIVGHSERRKHFAESDRMINKKLKAALKAKLKSIFCIGEKEKERKAGKTFFALKKQLKKGLKSIKKAFFKNLIIAYEPVWAIGTGKPCEIPDAKEVNLFLKKIFKNIPVLYGGSINSKIAKNYIKEANFDGLLVGGASLKAEEFIKIIKSCSAC